MASVAAWARFHYAVRAKGLAAPSKKSTVKWIIEPEIPENPPDDPGRPEVKVFVKPIQYRALRISAGRAGIPIYS